MATAPPGHKASRHSFIVFDRTLRRKFPVDSGVDISIIFSSLFQKERHNANFSIRSAYGSRKQFFVSALADFLTQFDLIVDLSTADLID